MYFEGNGQGGIHVSVCSRILRDHGACSFEHAHPLRGLGIAEEVLQAEPMNETSKQQQVEKLAMTAVEFPPMQKGASFNLDAVKAKIEAARTAMAK